MSGLDKMEWISNNCLGAVCSPSNNYDTTFGHLINVFGERKLFKKRRWVILISLVATA